MDKISPVIQTIKDEADRLGWSIQDLSEASGVTFQAIYRMLREENPASPNIETVNKLLKALKMKLVVAR